MLHDSDLDKDIFSEHHWNSFWHNRHESKLTILHLGGGNTYILMEITIVV